MGHTPGVYGADPKNKNVYKCTQATTAAPAIAYTLENGIDLMVTPPTIARTSAGIYTFTKVGAFTLNKTIARVQSNAATAVICQVVYTSADVITLNFFDAATPSAVDSGNFDFSIEVYP
jgi:hypothetical protein